MAEGDRSPRLMQPRRWPFLISAGAAILIAGVFLVQSIGDDLIYYLTPHEAMTQRADFPGGWLCNYPITRPSGKIIKLCENPVTAEGVLCYQHRDREAA